MHTLRVNEIKVTLRNIFIDNIFALESEEESKNDEGTHPLLRLPADFRRGFNP